MIAIIGGGASGLMAALTAAERGEQVVLLERQPRVGRKLLSTGNGRCNLSNLHSAPEHYHGADSAFTVPALAAFDAAAARQYFRSLGLLTVCEPDGRVYPLSNQAGSVVDVLRLNAAGRGVALRTDCQVQAIRREGAGFLLQLEQEQLRAQQVIVCCGGCAGAKVGGSSSGYRLLEGLGHRCTRLYPALVQLKTETALVRALKGVRADAALSLSQNDAPLASSSGEVQFTEYGVSGPAVFDISRAASVAGGGLLLTLDFLPQLTEDEIAAILRRRCELLPELPGSDLLAGILHNRLGQTLLRYCGLRLNMPAAALSNRQRQKIACAIKRFQLPVTGTLGFDSAQVTAGGIVTSQFNPQTLESRLVPGLYAAGEVLDIDGDCGGYNLHWAWASGRLAGRTL